MIARTNNTTQGGTQNNNGNGTSIIPLVVGVAAAAGALTLGRYSIFKREERVDATLTSDIYSNPERNNNLKKKYHSNWAIVRVWLPRNKKGNFVTAHEASLDVETALGRVGHASLQTDKHYMSFWPSWTGDKEPGAIAAILGGALGDLHRHPDVDITCEKGEEPEVVVVLYSLDIKKVNTAFEIFEKSDTAKRWSLLGANKFNVLNKGAGESCSGLVYYLLNIGGIKNLISWDLVSAAWTVAPDSVARAAVKAAETTTETLLSIAAPLPLNIISRIKKPGFDLNPHTNFIGHRMAEPHIRPKL